MKKKIFKTIIVVILVVISIMIGRSTKEDEVYEEVLPEVSKNLLSMMLEDENGEYILEKRDSWPSKEDGYIFNKKLSKCNNGSKVTWDDENNVVLFEGTSIDKCYIYFDIYNKITLADFVKNKFTGVQGENDLYYHEITLENGAGDNSYRYAGANPDNFVCFGSDDEVCPNDNLYRIIGVFGDKVKLIKYDYATSNLLGTGEDYKSACASAIYCVDGITSNYYKGNNTSTNIGAYWWNSSGTNTWSESKLNTVNLNTNYLVKIGKTWSDKIVTTSWIVGGNTMSNICNNTVKKSYVNEITNPSTEILYSAKIGLMYVSDYYYSAPSIYWTYVGYNSSDSSKDYSASIDSNWMYMGLREWTITPQTDNTTNAFLIRHVGNLGYINVNDSERAWAVRPVFYLNSDVTVSGNHQGTKTDPIRIN